MAFRVEHGHDKVQRWLRRHPRFHVHFTPASASWLNMVERFFRDLTESRNKRGVFRSVLELIEAPDGYVDHHNAEPTPVIWTAQSSRHPAESHAGAEYAA